MHEIMGCVMMLFLKDFQPQLYSQHYTTGSLAPRWILKVHADVFYWIYRARNIAYPPGTCEYKDTNIKISSCKTYINGLSIFISCFQKHCFSITYYICLCVHIYSFALYSIVLVKVIITKHISSYSISVPVLEVKIIFLHCH